MASAAAIALPEPQRIALVERAQKLGDDAVHGETAYAIGVEGE